MPNVVDSSLHVCSYKYRYGYIFHKMFVDVPALCKLQLTLLI